MTSWQEHRPTLIPRVSPCQLCVALRRLEQHKSSDNISYFKPFIWHTSFKWTCIAEQKCPFYWNFKFVNYHSFFVVFLVILVEGAELLSKAVPERKEEHKK